MRKEAVGIEITECLKFLEELMNGKHQELTDKEKYEWALAARYARAKVMAESFITEEVAMEMFKSVDME